MCHNTVLVIHGGAGTYSKRMGPQKEKLYHEALRLALQDGQEILAKNGPAIDAVEAAVKSMEDCPLFNAGKGSVFSHDETIEMDASIMDGRTLGAGSVAGVKTIKNPISAARAVMEKAEHVMLFGTGAESFAKQMKLELMGPSYFFTQERWDALQKVKNKNMTDINLGTVGAVARDREGNLAAATSTGGMNNKKYGRIGDSPIIGAGTYANNNTCAISSTGHGEYFIRLLVAHDISALMEYKNLSLEAAAHEVIKNKLTVIGGSGGIIGVDKIGNITMKFSTETMFRGLIRDDGKAQTFIFDTYSKII